MLLIINLNSYSSFNIIRGRKIDQKALKTIETENKFKVPHSRRDNGEIKRISRAIERKGILDLMSFIN